MSQRSAEPLVTVVMPAATDPVIEVTVVMPCLNESRTIERCVVKARRALEALGVQGEVIVADNGSIDGSADVAIGSGARVVRVERPGYGSALQGGIDAARGLFILIGDADDSYDFGVLAPFIDRLRRGDDLVMGNRFRGGIRPGAMPWHHRYIGNPVLTGVLNLFFHSPIGDAHCGFRGFRREAYNRLGLTSTGMEFASEMVVKACLNRLKVTEIPVVLYPDGRDRRPHLRSFRDGWRHLRLLLLLCPTWLYLIPGLTLMAIGLVLMASLTKGPRWVGQVMLDIHTMLLGSLCVLLANQSLWLWACARRYGRSVGLFPGPVEGEGLEPRFQLETGLLTGLALMAAGFSLNVALLGQWIGRDFGSLESRMTLRYAVWGLTTLVVGAQTISGSFLLGLLSFATASAAKVRATPAARRPVWPGRGH